MNRPAAADTGENEAVTHPGPGRSRQILDAAAELFTTRGYASTSTRGIADAVGIRQASLYHHFASKDDMLDALLDETVTGALALAVRLAEVPDPAAVRLYALARFDVHQLCSTRWNLGSLYFLPEVRSERFAAFRRRRDELRGHYEHLAALVIAAGPRTEARILPFRLVESVINVRSDEGIAPAYACRVIPDAILPMIGWVGDVDEVRASADALLDRLAPSRPPVH
ncbi:TetR/AcrR family transcriptional regulator [Nocardia terpenica]|uniref:TetR family transcriptional regulator n=1 Tax=Nocardia terpenica TaxID=455432 RepID=A0A291RXR5_9NOCA|nr:TetR family transcriptional regulator [Nocardia terpenica]